MKHYISVGQQAITSASPFIEWEKFAPNAGVGTFYKKAGKPERHLLLLYQGDEHNPEEVEIFIADEGVTIEEIKREYFSGDIAREIVEVRKRAQ